MNHIYHPLAESNGQVLALLRALKAKGGDQKAKLFQFLNQIGAGLCASNWGVCWKWLSPLQTRKSTKLKLCSGLASSGNLNLSFRQKRPPTEAAYFLNDITQVIAHKIKNRLITTARPISSGLMPYACKESLGPPQDQGSPSGTHRYITGALARNRGESGEQSYLWFVYIRDQIKSQVVPDNPVKTG